MNIDKIKDCIDIIESHKNIIDNIVKDENPNNYSIELKMRSGLKTFNVSRFTLDSVFYYSEDGHVREVTWLSIFEFHMGMYNAKGVCCEL